MKRLLLVLAVVSMAVPAWGLTDFFPLSGAGSFDTYSQSGTQEGYSNGGSGASARLGYTRQGLGWMAWDAQDSTGTRHTSVGDVSGQTLNAFVTANGIASASLWVNMAPTPTGTGTYAITSLRIGNTGLIQADGGSPNVGGSYLSPSAAIGGSTQDYAWRSAAGPFSANGRLSTDEAYIAVGTTSSHYLAQFTAGQQVKWQPGGIGPFYGWDSTMEGNGGAPWALNCVLGGDWSQGGVSVARAQTAGQVVNVNPVNTTADMLLNVAAAGQGASPRPASSGSNWVSVPINLALAYSIATDPQTKAIVLNNWFAGTSASSGNPSFYGPNQNNSANSFLMITTPEPATMILLALGGLALIRRRA